MKKRFLLSLLCVVFLLIGTSCVNTNNNNSNDENDTNIDVTDDNFLKAEAKDRIDLSYKDKIEEGYVNFLAKIQNFSTQISEELYLAYGNEYDNIAVSPVSIYMALALAIECANDNTRDEILNAIGVTYEEVRKYTKNLFSELNKEYYDDQEELAALRLLTNSIWFEESVTLQEVGLNNLANDYNCSSYGAPFKNNNAAANKALRDYVCKNTKGLIDQDFELSVDTLMALVNTLYLKDIWNNDGDELLLTDKKYSFTNYKQETKDINLLQGYYKSGKVKVEDQYSHFFTTTAKGLKIKFMLPHDGYTVDDIYTKENLAHVNRFSDYEWKNEDTKTIYSTRILFPEFKAEFDEDIKEVIKDKFNVRDLFDSSRCDFSNIIDLEKNGEEGIYCSNIIHKTKLIVDKTGIEGAAVTIIVMVPESADPSFQYTHEYYDFVIDRDFAYLVTDNSGTILFSGVVKNVE